MSEQTARPSVVEVGDAKPPRALRLRVRQALERGEIVALPTETVYGLAVRADDARAVQKLRELKGRAPDSSLTWHVARREEVDRFDALRPLARRLAARYWPGPLTLVLRGVPGGLEHVAQDGWTGARLPAHEATRGLLAALDFPVVATSANRHGEPPATDAAAVAELFGRSLAIVLDGGPARLGEASGVLRVGPGRFELLREGLLPLADLRRVAGLRIGFVCTGNTCRSPMAERLARRILERRLGIAEAAEPTDIEAFGFEIRSMGLAAGAGSPASRHAIDVLATRGLDLKDHRSSPTIPERLRELDRVYCLTHGHREGVRALLPPGGGPELILLDPQERDVLDPIGGSRAEYERCAERIEEALEVRAADWA